jgi:hypothetical protein
MSNELIKAIIDAYEAPESESHINKANRCFLKHEFILPIRKKSSEQDDPQVLFFTEKNMHFMPVFSSEDIFKDWAKDSLDDMSWLNIMGKDLVLGTGEDTFICLDVGQEHYKEFTPQELMRLKQVVMKLEKMAKSS